MLKDHIRVINNNKRKKGVKGGDSPGQEKERGCDRREQQALPPLGGGEPAYKKKNRSGAQKIRSDRAERERKGPLWRKIKSSRRRKSARRGVRREIVLQVIS